MSEAYEDAASRLWWGVRRFMVRDPAGRTVNVLSHARPA